MTPLYRNRAVELAIQNALMERISARYYSPIRKEINARMNKAANLYEQYGDTGIDMAMQGHRENIEGIFNSLWTLSIERFAERTIQAKQGIVEGAIRYWFNNFAYPRIVNVTNTTLRQIREIISNNTGQTDAQIGNAIRDVAPQLARYRADTIARTETHGSSQYGSISGAREVDSTLRKEWISAGDDRTRDGDFDHVSADGDIVNMNESFTVSSEQLDYPGDDSQGASAGNLINCRCVVGYVRP